LSLLFWIVVLFSALTLASPSSDDADEHRDNTAFPQTQAPLTGLHSARPGQTEAVNVQQAAEHRASSDTRGHLPVSRPLYSAPGSAKHKKPRRHHHLSGYLIRHAK